jgi:hypothetical protein
MAIKPAAKQPVTAVPGPEYVRLRLTLADIAEWVDSARAAGVTDGQEVKAQITWGGWLKQLSVTPGDRDG